MKKTTLLVQILLALLVIVACGPDDGPGRVPIRDAAEVYAEDLIELKSFLDTHFYNYEAFQASPTADIEILFDTIAGANSSKIPLSQQVEVKTLRRGGIDYNYYILRVRQGEGSGRATFADSTLVSYKGSFIDRSVFDNSDNPVWFDLPVAISGFTAAITEFNDASSATQQPDGVVTFSGAGVGAVFMPSGLGYFASPVTGIPLYSPLIFTFKVCSTKITDHDGDGILSRYEDLDGDGNLRTPGGDNTDGDQNPGFNYLDPDDDGDGIPTRLENADPNGDGNPDDALDSDGDGIPDYLDNNTRG